MAFTEPLAPIKRFGKLIMDKEEELRHVENWLEERKRERRLKGKKRRRPNVSPSRNSKQPDRNAGPKSRSSPRPGSAWKRHGDGIYPTGQILPDLRETRCERRTPVPRSGRASSAIGQSVVE